MGGRGLDSSSRSSSVLSILVSLVLRLPWKRTVCSLENHGIAKCDSKVQQKKVVLTSIHLLVRRRELDGLVSVCSLLEWNGETIPP